MKENLNLSKKSFAIYGLGTTGKSVINYLKKKKVKNYYFWDDKKEIRNSFKSINKINNFSQKLDIVDFIVLSPGINLKKTKFYKKIKQNKKKIITDIDLFFLSNSNLKSIVVTGTNGKSTTCKIIEHLFKRNKIDVKVGGNIGKPILDLKLKKKTIVIIEASSFQLSYSKFIKPDYALILNISKDHLDWHGTMANYINSKLNIFSNQEKNNYALLNSRNLLKKFYSNKYKGKIKFIHKNDYNKIKDKIKNSYLGLKSNEENMTFVYALSKIFKIKLNKFLFALKSFKGLPHRYEIFYKKKNITFINDSKATSFQASSLALQSSTNIFWIVGGLPKVKDNFNRKFKKNINRAYIIGDYSKHFEKQLKFINSSKYKKIKHAVIQVLKDIQGSNKKSTVLLSPASASYDQYKNFNHRGDEFKRIVKIYAKKYI